MSTAPTEPIREPGIPGKYVVIAMLCFGICTTGFMWIYTYLNNRPFIPLRHALVQRFKRETSPRVEGGKERGRGASKLRIVLTVQFDPSLETPENQKLRSGMEQDAIALAKQHLDLTPYERWEFILIRYTPEGLPKRWESKRDMSELRDQPPTPQPAAP
jgi:hypothetical protein